MTYATMVPMCFSQHMIIVYTKTRTVLLRSMHTYNHPQLSI